MASDRTGYMQEWVRPPIPACGESGCERRVKLEVHASDGSLIGLFCQSDGVKAPREHNRQVEVGTPKEVATR